MKGRVTMTIEDIYSLPDGKRAELIDGQIYFMAPPSRKHQDLLMELSRIIANYIHEKMALAKSIPHPSQSTLMSTPILMWNQTFPLSVIKANWMPRAAKVHRTG